jgi:hypothetical protein
VGEVPVQEQHQLLLHEADAVGSARRGSQRHQSLSTRQCCGVKRRGSALAGVGPA